MEHGDVPHSVLDTVHEERDVAVTVMEPRTTMDIVTVPVPRRVLVDHPEEREETIMVPRERPVTVMVPERRDETFHVPHTETRTRMVEKVIMVPKTIVVPEEYEEEVMVPEVIESTVMVPRRKVETVMVPEVRPRQITLQRPETVVVEEVRDVPRTVRVPVSRVVTEHVPREVTQTQMIAEDRWEEVPVARQVPVRRVQQCTEYQTVHEQVQVPRTEMVQQCVQDHFQEQRLLTFDPQTGTQMGEGSPIPAHHDPYTQYTQYTQSPQPLPTLPVGHPGARVGSVDTQHIQQQIAHHDAARSSIMRDLDTLERQRSALRQQRQRESIRRGGRRFGGSASLGMMA